MYLRRIRNLTFRFNIFKRWNFYEYKPRFNTEETIDLRQELSLKYFEYFIIIINI